MNNTISGHLWMCRVYFFPLPAVCSGDTFHQYQHQQHGHAGCTSFLREMAGCIPILAYSVDVQGVYISFLKCRMPDCPASGHSGTIKKKNVTPEPVQYRKKGTQFGTGLRVRKPDASGIGLDDNVQL